MTETAPTFRVVPRPEPTRRVVYSFEPTPESRLVGARLRGLRIDKGKTLEQAAADLGPAAGSSATLARTEAGTRAISSAALRALATYYGTTVEALTAPSDAPEPWEIVTGRNPYTPKPESTVMTPEQYALRVYIPQLEAKVKDLEEQLAMFRGER